MMFGEIGGWFFKGLGGIKPDENHPGFKHIRLEPYFPEGLDAFESKHSSPYGEIKSAWKKQGKTVVMDIIIPANSTATLKWPDGKSQNLSAGKHQLKWKE